MQKRIIAALLVTTLVPSIWATNITAIMGSGIQPDNWTDTVSGNLQLALRAKNRGDVIPAYVVPVPVGSTYTFGSGTDGARGPFNYEFSINSNYTGAGSNMLSFYDYFLAVDRDPSAGISYSIVAPLFHWGDNSYGLFGTGQGAGLEPGSLADYLGFPNLYSIVQNSQNITFGDYPGGALAEVANATYNYELFAVEKGQSYTSNRLASVGITVVVGTGGSSVPETGSTVALLGVAFFGLAALRRRFVR